MHRVNIDVVTGSQIDILDITREVADAVIDSGMGEGVAVVFCPGSTGAITTIEFESGAVSDLAQAIERIAPKDIAYAHNARWGDGNGHSHVRAALLGPSLSIPFSNGRLSLGTWQQVVFVDFDNRSRNRRLICQVIGE